MIEADILLKTAELAARYSATVHPDLSILQGELDAISLRAHKLHFPALIEDIEKMLAAALPLKEEILSINQVRNCLVHKNAIVAESLGLMEILMNVTTPFRRKLTTHSGRN